jgi:acyl dehydratase
MTKPDQRLYWEDFSAGASVDFGETRVTATDILAFADEFDRQPAHLGDVLDGQLTASDWHTCAMLMRMMCDDFLYRAAGAGAPGVEHVKWYGTVRPDDILRVTRTPLETRASKSRPRIGIVRMLLEVFNQRDEKVLSWLPVQLYDRRDPSAEPPPPEVFQLRDPDTPPRAPPELSRDRRNAMVGGFEDIPVGRETALGSHTFSAENMLGYATRFNPQYFHADEAAATASLYGGLIASGWHTAAIWNRLFVEHRHEFGAETPSAGSVQSRHAHFGPSTAVLDMKWPNPVRPGDTISFGSRIVEKSEPAAFPDWGLITSLNEGVNQRGEMVLSLIHQIWVARHGPARHDGRMP